MRATDSSPVGATHLPGWVLPVILLLFFLSGLSGLIYEVIWTRLLLTVFGATLYAVAAVLAAFMGGLAVGSFLGGKVADRVARPLLVYGVLELLVAATALAVPAALRLFDPFYEMVYASGQASFLQLSLVRFAVSFLILLVPTTCMGATLPLLSRYLVRRGGIMGSRIGGLYAVNTTGAVAGTFLAGFVLIAWLGVWGSIVFGAALSALVGLVAIAASWTRETGSVALEARSEPLASELADNPQPSWLAQLVLVTYGISGFVALSYQVFWTRALVFRFEILKNTTYSFSAMLTVFLIGLATGSAVMSLLVNRQRNPVRLYGLIQILTGVSGALSLFVLLGVAGALRLGDPEGPAGAISWGMAVGNVFLRTGATIFLPTFLMGMAFPLAARICIRRLGAIGSGTGRLYAINTVGAICGSFAAGFMLIPVFGLARGLLALGLVNVLLGTVVLVADPNQDRRSRLGWLALAGVICTVFAVASPGPAPFQDLLETHFIVTDEDDELAYVEGPLATVSVVEDAIGHRVIHIDNSSVAGTDRILLTDQKSLAHIPALLLENPRSALTVGFGSGGASWSYLQYREMERVDCIEICASVPRLAHTLRASNHGLLDQWDRQSSLVGQTFHAGRFRVIIDDARSYLRFTKTRYDIIATDCTDLRYKSNANLYDVEYFELCRDAITEQGMVVVWMPLAGMSPEVFACAMRTFAHVFPDMSVWFMHNEPTHYLLLIATPQPLRINIARMRERISRLEIRNDLAEVSLHQAEKILSCFLTTAPAIEEHLRALNPVLNTENTPFLEFESPKFGLGDEPLLANLEILRQHRQPVTPYLDDSATQPEFMARLDRFVAAVDTVLAGHAHLRRLDLRQAARSYLAAKEICPADESLDFLLGFDDLRRRMKRNPYDAWAVLSMAEITLIRGHPGAAARGFGLAQEITARRIDAFGEGLFERAVLGQAEAYLKMGVGAQAQYLLDQHRDLFGDRDEYRRLESELANPPPAGSESPSN